MATDSKLRIERQQISLKQAVANSLREQILLGVLEPGRKLVERELCENLGVSRTLLREALQQLQAEGLVTNILHRGPSVAVISETDAREIYRVRELLEAEAGRGFAVHATEEQLDELASRVEMLRHAAATGEPGATLEAKNLFYETLLGACGNTVIASLLIQLNNRVTLLRRMSMGHPGRIKQTIIELDEIVAAARHRDADTVGLLCGAHVARAAQAALEEFAKQGQVARAS